MSKNSSNFSWPMFAVHCFLLLITVGLWAFPLFIHYFITWARGRKPSAFLVAGHSILCIMTSGFWILFVVLWYLMRR